MKKYKYFIITFFIINFVFANDKIGTTSAAFLKIEPGARAVGLGGAFTAVCDDATSIYWNPAGITTIKNKEVTFMHNEWLLDIKYEFLSYVQKLGKTRGFGVGITELHMDPMQITTDLSEESNETFTARDRAFILSYAQNFIGLSYGITGKYVTQKLADKFSNGIIADFGILYQLKLANKPLNLGLNISNFGYMSKFIEKQQILPTKYVLGLMYNLHKDKINDIKISSDVIQFIDSDVKISTGVEYLLKDTFAFRLGYRIGYDFGNLTFGIGLKYPGEKNIYKIDYTYVNYTNLDATHRISFTCVF